MSSKGGKNWGLSGCIAKIRPRRERASEKGRKKEHKGNSKRPAGIFNLLKILINVPIIRKCLLTYQNKSKNSKNKYIKRKKNK